MEADLAMFTGSETFYRHGLNRKVVFTEGAHHVAQAGGAFWLLDEIALIQPYEPRVAAQPFQVWTLNVRANRTAALTCEEAERMGLVARRVSSLDEGVAKLTSEILAKSAAVVRLAEAWTELTS